VPPIRILGVPVRFHFTFALLLVFLITASLGARRPVMFEVLYIAAMFSSVLVHELGHAVAARLFGIRTLEIVMYPIGGVARLERQGNAKAELCIALAGPLVNVVIWAGLALPMLAGGGSGEVAGLLTKIGESNLYLGAFNMAPAFPMDGGRVLRALLTMWKGETSATRIATRAGRTLAILMGLYGLVTGKIFLLLIAFLIYSAAWQEGAASQGRALTQGIPVSAAMVTEFVTLDHGSTMADASDKLLATTQQDFPVVHAGRVIGLLDRTRLVRGMAQEGATSYVSAAMDRDFLRFDPSMDLAEALTNMPPSTVCALVMKDEELVGLLTRENVSEYLLLRQLGRSRQ
jgi:Zn-dependent protease